jgi:hypothetical protein
MTEIQAARAAGLAYGQHPAGTFAAGYTGAEIRAAAEVTKASALYEAYCEGYCEGLRRRAALLGCTITEAARKVQP